MNPLKLRLNFAATAALAALVLLGFIAVPALARTSVSVNLNIGGPGVEWNQPPPMVVVPGTRVSWVQGYADADVYEYGSLWYCYRGGRWYRSAGYRGPWVVVGGGSVPRDITGVRGGYHHFDHGVVAGSARGHGRRGGFRRDPIGGPSQRGHHGMSGNLGNTGQHSHPGNPAQSNGHAGPGNNGHPGGKGQPGGPEVRGGADHGSRGDGGDGHR